MLQSAPRASLCAEAFMPIEADLEAFSPGRVGVLHQYNAHERLKSLLAFRKRATHADSRHPARTEGL